MIKMSCGLTTIMIAGEKEARITGTDSEGLGTLQWWNGIEWVDFMRKLEVEGEDRKVDSVLVRMKR